MYQIKTVKKNIDLLLMEDSQMYHVLIKDFNTFMYYHSLHSERKHFCCCLQVFSTEEILTHHVF